MDLALVIRLLPAVSIAVCGVLIVASSAVAAESATVFGYNRVGCRRRWCRHHDRAVR